GVLVFKRLQPTSLRHVEPAELVLPFVKCRRADPVTPTHLRRRHSGFLLPQDPDDLLFREPLIASFCPSFVRADSSYSWRSFRGSRQSARAVWAWANEGRITQK